MNWKSISEVPGKPVVLVIIDGFGFSLNDYDNAVLHAKTPNIDYLATHYPFTLLNAAGKGVGLPPGQQGNSEVGHLNLGAGRIVYQDIVRIDLAIEDGSFFENPVLKNAMLEAKKRGKKLHLLGLVSDGGVHSHINHLKALLRMANKLGLDKVYVHAFTDGRDTSPTAGAKYIQDLINYMKTLGTGSLATIVGRYYAMDRDKRWDRTEKAYDLLVLGKGKKVDDPIKEMTDRYTAGVETDEFLTPILVDSEGLIENGDVVIFFNFRADRARQLTRAIGLRDVPFDLKKDLSNVYFVTMTQYDADFDLPVAFPPEQPKNTLPETISKNRFRQFHTAETEKYAHVTFFFNGGREDPVPGEDRIMIPSPKVATYDLKPEMSTFEVSETVVKAINKKEYAFILCNIAAPDMVGHSGKLKETIIAVESADKAVGQIYEASMKNGYVLIVTADHGNSEQLKTPDGKPHTAHTTNPVPFMITLPKETTMLKKGILGNVAPTILEVMSLEKPPEMIESLFISSKNLTEQELPEHHWDEIVKLKKALTEKK